MVLLPYAMAQNPGRGGRSPGRGGDRGNIDSMRGGGRGGIGRGGFPSRRDGELTDEQIDLILKLYSTNHSKEETEQLQEQRKTLSRERFISTLRNAAWPEYIQVMMDERQYTPLLDQFEKYIPDEATGIRELKSENYDLYKKRIDILASKYRSVIPARPGTPEALIPIQVRKLQLDNEQRDLVMQYWNPSTTDEKKQTILASLKEIITERYELNVQQRVIQYQQIQKEIDRLQEMLAEQMKQVEIWNDIDFKTNEIDSN